MEPRDTPAGRLVQGLYNEGHRDIDTVMAKSGLKYGTVRQYLAACRAADPNAEPPERRKGTVRGAEPEEDAPLKQKAAHAFIIRARKELRKAGKPSTIRAVGELLEATPAFISSCLTGRQGSLDTIARWIETWKSKGLTSYEMRVRANAVEIRRVRE